MAGPLSVARARALGRRARAAARFAYAPASGFKVGAALLGADGRVYTGCNVENASYGLTICAERNAAFTAVARGCRRFHAVAVHTPLAPPGYPCGACLQVLAEFGPDMAVVLVGRGRGMVMTDLRSLLAHPFRFGGKPRR
jgi:cytidine deaminase